jgi:hypothetical protein
MRVEQPGPTRFTQLTDVPQSFLGASLKTVSVNLTETALTFSTGGGGGSTTFIGLTDVPATYTGAALKGVRVNAGETALEFFTLGGGTGTVTNFSFTNANGISGSVLNPTTTPALTLMLGAITPTSVAASGSITGSNLSGNNTGDQTSIVGITGTLAQFNTAITDADITPTSRTLNTTAPLSGGGDLSTDRTLTTSMATNKLIGRGTAGTGVFEEITLGTNLSLSGTTLNASGGGGGSATIYQTTIDFGSTEKSDEVFNIVDAGISAISKITAFVTWVSTLGRDADEIMADPIHISIEPLAGSMNIYAMAAQGTVNGKYAVNYLIG